MNLLVNSVKHGWIRASVSFFCCLHIPYVSPPGNTPATTQIFVSKHSHAKRKVLDGNKLHKCETSSIKTAICSCKMVQVPKPKGKNRSHLAADLFTSLDVLWRSDR